MKMSVLDTACRRVLRMKFALGLFENPYTDEKRADKILRCPEHLTTAEKIAEKSIVLLKNDGLLPIRKDLRSVAVIGPAADTVSYGDYTETRGRKGGVSVLQSAPKPRCCTSAAATFWGRRCTRLVRPCCTMKTAKPG